jgi:hypothetical protein
MQQWFDNGLEGDAVADRGESYNEIKSAIQHDAYLRENTLRYRKSRLSMPILSKHSTTGPLKT